MPQELKRQGSGEEITFIEALSDKKIIHSSLDELKNVLTFCMIKIGLRSASFPAAEEKAVLIDHILKEFGGHTCQEIKLAFEMAIAGKLTDYNSKGEPITLDANCYENFSCLYFSKIMKAYRIWAEDVYKFVKRIEPMYQIEDKRELTDNDMESWVQETKYIAINEAKIPLMPIAIYEWLVSKKILKITKEQRNDYLQIAVNIRHNQLLDYSRNEDQKSLDQLKEFNKMKEVGIFEGYESNCIRDLAKKVSVYFYLQETNV